MPNKLCKSCGGPVDNHIHKDKGFCSYCVNEKGYLKTYSDILDGMINYIKTDHKNIKEEDRLKVAKEMLEKDSISWNEIFTGVIIEESLNNKELLKLFKITKTVIEQNNDPITNAGEKIWTLHTVEIKRSNLDKALELLKKSLKLPNWWADLNFKDEVVIVFNNKIFKGNKKDKNFVNEVINYGRKVKLPESQIPLLNL